MSVSLLNGEEWPSLKLSISLCQIVTLADGDFIQQAKKVKVASAQVSAHICLAVNKLLLYDVEL